jgi:hypothetical protein
MKAAEEYLMRGRGSSPVPEQQQKKGSDKMRNKNLDGSNHRDAAG